MVEEGQQHTRDVGVLWCGIVLRIAEAKAGIDENSRREAIPCNDGLRKESSDGYEDSQTLFGSRVSHIGHGAVFCWRGIYGELRTESRDSRADRDWSGTSSLGPSENTG